MIKKFKYILCFTLILLIVGCASDEEKIKSNCSALECIKIIEPKNTVEEVNKITGVEGVLYDKKNNFYRYDLENGDTITLKYYSGNSAIVSASYNKKKLANRKVDLSNLKNLEKKVDSGIKYDEFIKQIGGVDGILIEKTDLSSKYIWVSKNGGYIYGSFRNENNKCSFFAGYGDTR